MTLPQSLPLSPLPGLRSVALTLRDEALLQRFFEANPAYFLAVQGEPAGPGEAHEELAGELPPEISYSCQWVIGYLGADGELVAMANLVAGIFVPSVWNLSTFIVATARHGSGDAQVLYRSLEAWVTQSGAHWLRLGVVKGNERAERFWSAQGFVETKQRENYPVGQQFKVLRVMAKPLARGSIEDYLTLLPRDRP